MMGWFPRRRRSAASATNAGSARSGSRLSRPAPVLVLLAMGTGLSGCFWVAATPRESKAPPTVPTSSLPTPTPVVDVRTTQRPLTSQEAEEYLGDAACARCHSEIANNQAKTAHRRTLRAVTGQGEGAAFEKTQVVKDEVRGLSYRTAVFQNQCVMQATDGRRSGTIRADLVLGSGRNAMTFLSAQGPDECVKMRLTYYTRKGRWHFTPASFPKDPISSPAGTIEKGLALEKCLMCHVTVMRQDSGQLNLAESRFGIGCERCHGPGKSHVEQVRLVGKDPDIERLDTVTPSRISKLCGSCHHDSSHTRLEDARTQQNLSRFQGIALEQSPCYKKSGKLSCVTCHDPHRDSGPDLARYDATCRGCHTREPEHRVCRVNSRSGCTGCHMPSQSVKGIPFASYRNHWIKVWK